MQRMTTASEKMYDALFDEKSIEKTYEKLTKLRLGISQDMEM